MCMIDAAEIITDQPLDGDTAEALQKLAERFEREPVPPWLAVPPDALQNALEGLDTMAPSQEGTVRPKVATSYPRRHHSK
jgi:hypothetical protein